MGGATRKDGQTATAVRPLWKDLLESIWRETYMEAPAKLTRMRHGTVRWDYKSLQTKTKSGPESQLAP